MPEPTWRSWTAHRCAPPAASWRLRRRWAARCPTRACGAAAALRELIEHGEPGLARTGPRFFHFVQGGATPAALARRLADLGLGSEQLVGRGGAVHDAAGDGRAALAAASCSGCRPTGAACSPPAPPCANLAALACAAPLVGRCSHGVDVDERGLAGLPPVPVIAGGYVHPSDAEGAGRCSASAAGAIAVSPRPRRAPRPGRGGAPRCRRWTARPAILIGSAGEVNAGDFDPLDAAGRPGRALRRWLHVDGAFGLFAALSDRTRATVAGVERADSVIADGHKWLNVPYDCGFAFVRDRSLTAAAVRAVGRLPGRRRRAGARPTATGRPESSRRARCLAVWATLRAYGRDGHRLMVERHLDLAQRLAAARRRRARPGAAGRGAAERRLLPLPPRRRRRGRAGRAQPPHRRGRARATARVYFGTTLYGGQVAFRPAICNWMTGEADVDAIAETVRRLGAELSDAA